MKLYKVGSPLGISLDVARLYVCIEKSREAQNYPQATFTVWFCLSVKKNFMFSLLFLKKIL